MMTQKQEQEIFEQAFRQGKTWALRMQYMICEKNGTLDTSYCVTPNGIITMRPMGQRQQMLRVALTSSIQNIEPGTLGTVLQHCDDGRVLVIFDGQSAPHKLPENHVRRLMIEAEETSQG